MNGEIRAHARGTVTRPAPVEQDEVLDALRQVYDSLQQQGDARGTVTRPADLCCDMHNSLCEQGGDECCNNCSEARHYSLNHGDTLCVLKDGRFHG